MRAIPLVKLYRKIEANTRKKEESEGIQREIVLLIFGRAAGTVITSLDPRII